jgi:hypothetical protein
VESGGINRREILGLTGAAAVCGALPVWAQAGMPRRTIPATGELLPVIGLGSSKVVEGVAANGTAPLAGVLRELVANGGRVVDTWPRNEANDRAFGEVINAPDLSDALWVTTKIDRTGREAGIA